MAERSLLERFTRGAACVILPATPIVAISCAPQPPAQVRSTEIPSSPVVPVTTVEAKVAATTVAGVAATSEATTQPSTTPTETPVPPTATSTATEIPPSPTTAPTTAPTIAPTVAPTRITSGETLTLPRYAAFVGDLINTRTKDKGSIILSYLPDSPDQQNMLFIYTSTGRGAQGYLFVPQSIQKKENGFQSVQARALSKMGEVMVISNTKLRAEIYSPRALTGQLNFSGNTDTLTFNLTSSGSGKDFLLDEAVKMFVKSLGLSGPGVAMNRDGMIKQLALAGITLP